jgi:hypothetical protein
LLRAFDDFHLWLATPSRYYRLLGILTAQVSTYHVRYPHDRPVYKFLVSF